MFSSTGVPRCGIQGERSRGLVGWNRRVPGPSDGPTTGRMGSHHPHRAAQVCTLSGELQSADYSRSDQMPKAFDYDLARNANRQNDELHCFILFGTFWIDFQTNFLLLGESFSQFAVANDETEILHTDYVVTFIVCCCAGGTQAPDSGRGRTAQRDGGGGRR